MRRDSLHTLEDRVGVSFICFDPWVFVHKNSFVPHVLCGPGHDIALLDETYSLRFNVR
jgi:hypothetical protein